MRPGRFVLFMMMALGWPGPEATANDDSVYHISPGLDAAIISLSAVAAILPMIYSDKLISPNCPCDPAKVNPLDRQVIGNSNDSMGTVSDILVGLSLAGPVIADWIQLTDHRIFVKDLVVYAETLSINSALNAWVKVSAHRPLPRTYAGDPELLHKPAGYRSFYSSHVSMTMAALSTAAVTMNLRHHSGAWPWIVVAGAGAGVAAGRIAAGRHFYTDTFAGAAAGVAIGTLVPLLHHWNKSRQTTVQLIPLPQGIQLSWSWRLH